MTSNSPDAQEEQKELTQFLELLRGLQYDVRHIALPMYFTDEQRDEWRSILNRYENELRWTIEKAEIELDKEEWYAS